MWLKCADQIGEGFSLENIVNSLACRGILGYLASGNTAKATQVYWNMLRAHSQGSIAVSDEKGNL